MESVNKNYVITKQMKFDFQIVLMARNETVIIILMMRSIIGLVLIGNYDK